MRKIELNMGFEHPDSLTGDEWIEIEETVANQLVLHKLDENYFPTLDGMICEDILGKLP